MYHRRKQIIRKKQKNKINEISNVFIKELLEFKGVELILLSKNFLSVEKTKDVSWNELKPMVISLLNDYFEKNNEPILKDNKISIEDINIIIYGNNKNDETSNELIKTLLSLNFPNVLKYIGGLEEWNKMKEIKEDEKELDIDDETMIIEYAVIFCVHCTL